MSNRFCVVLVGLMMLVLFPKCVLALDGDRAVLYVPNLGQEGIYIPLEIVIPGEDNPQGRATMQSLKSKMEGFFHLAGSGAKESPGKCQVTVLPGDASAFRMSCWSAVQWSGGDPYEKQGQAASPDEVLQFGRTFAEEHFKRARQSVPLKRRPISVRTV